MEEYFEYACANGKGFISEFGTEEQAMKILERNYRIAQDAGDRSRYDYHIVYRRCVVHKSKWMRRDGN